MAIFHCYVSSPEGNYSEETWILRRSWRIFQVSMVVSMLTWGFTMTWMILGIPNFQESEQTNKCSKIYARFWTIPNVVFMKPSHVVLFNIDYVSFFEFSWRSSRHSHPWIWRPIWGPIQGENLEDAHGWEWPQTHWYPQGVVFFCWIFWGRCFFRNTKR